MRFCLRALGVAAALAATIAAPAAHADVPPGFDLFETDPEATVFHFREDFQIPPNFFGEGSRPFAGSVRFGGDPIGRFNAMPVGDADTVVRRVAAADTDQPDGGRVPIELVALSLVSVQPLAVGFGARTELWEASAELSPTRPSQGDLRVLQDGQGGLFDSRFTVYPKFTFTQICISVDPACDVPERAQTRTLDTGALPLSGNAREQLTLGADRVPWQTACDLPALGVPGLNDGFCPSSQPQAPRVLTVEESRLAKHGIRPAPPRLEHFSCYGDRARRFRPRTVLLTDQFGAERARVRAPRSVCAPVRKNAEEAVDNRQAHLQCYTIARAEQKVRPPQDVFTRNQFGTLRLRVGPPRALCVPSLKSRTRRPPQSADPSVERVLDHFKCYGVRPQVIRWRPRRVRLRDQFGQRTATVLRPAELCLPTKKNDEAAGYPVRHLLCYRVQHTWRPLPVRIDNQFGTQFLRVVRPFTLCVPTLKVWRPVTPPEQPPPTGDPPTTNDPPPFTGSGTFTPFQPGEVTFVIRFNRDVNGFRIVVPGNRRITNDLPPNGFQCQPGEGNTAYDCAGNLPAGTDASGRLQTNPPPQQGMGGQLFGREGAETRGPFPITGP